VTMLDVAMALWNDRAATFLATGDQPRRMGSSLATTAPHRVYPAADGDIVVGAANDTLYRRLAGLLGPPVEGDTRFETLPGRVEHRQALDQLIADALRTQPTAHWLERLDAAGVPAASVRDLAEAVERHARLSTTGFHEFAELPGLRIVAPPVVLGDGGFAPPPPGPIGRDTDEVLRGFADMDGAAIARLRTEGVVVG
jgi:crotonobetainyl-CoA:carnitine CoA-transferase CaiB-like acyl-CoA transferase